MERKFLPWIIVTWTSTRRHLWTNERTILALVGKTGGRWIGEGEGRREIRNKMNLSL